jgi:hypothetical protein
MNILRRRTLTTVGLALLCAIVFGVLAAGARGQVEPLPPPLPAQLPPPPSLL